MGVQKASITIERQGLKNLLYKTSLPYLAKIEFLHKFKPCVYRCERGLVPLSNNSTLTHTHTHSDNNFLKRGGHRGNTDVGGCLTPSPRITKSPDPKRISVSPTRLAVSHHWVNVQTFSRLCWYNHLKNQLATLIVQSSTLYMSDLFHLFFQTNLT